MPKERNINPVQAQRKADKAKAIKKGKTEQITRRNEKLAQRNPERIQTQIDDLKAVTNNGGKLSRHEEQVLEGLENDLKAVQKAREALGDKAPTFGRGGGQWGDRGGGERGVLGKRRREADDASSDEDGGADVPEDVRSIPMPRDTPPPIPREILDAWYARRRARRQANANMEPLGDARTNGRGEGRAAGAGAGDDQAEQTTRARSERPPAYEAKTVYEAAPVVRDLKKEAVSAFTPAVVREKMEKGKGQGGLMEPEEAERLEKEGYMKASSAGADEAGDGDGPRGVTMEEAEDEEG